MGIIFDISQSTRLSSSMFYSGFLLLVSLEVHFKNIHFSKRHASNTLY